jgi:hypothetical protein
MISQHGFFEGRGAYFRIEPEALWAVIAPEAEIPDKMLELKNKIK